MGVAGVAVGHVHIDVVDVVIEVAGSRFEGEVTRPVS